MQKNVWSIFIVDSEPCRAISQRAVSPGSLKDKGWKHHMVGIQVTARTRKRVPPPSQNLTSKTGTFCSRCETLEQKARHLIRCVKVLLAHWSSLNQHHLYLTSPFVKRKRKVVVIGDSFLRETEDPIHRLDLTEKSSVSKGHE